MRTTTKRLLGAGILAGAAYAVWRALRTPVPSDASGPAWETAPFPFPPAPRPGGRTHVPPEVEPGGGPETEALGEAHVPPYLEPHDDGSCPSTHPVKGKVSSGIYHVPGGANYDRVNADRCYVDTAAAEADGMRRAQH